MNEEATKPIKNKTVTAAGAACLPVAAMFLTFGTVLVVGLIQMLSAPQADYGIYYVLYFFDGAMTVALTVFGIAFAIIFYAFTAGYVLMSVVLFKQDKNNLTKVALLSSLVISAVICAISLYPFITGLLRTIIHGAQNELTRFLVLGLLPLSLSSVSITLSAITVKKMEKK